VTGAPTPPGARTRAASGWGPGPWRRLIGVLWVVALVGLGGLAASCGVPTSAAPKSIPSAQVPDHLLSPSGPLGATATTVPIAEPVTVTIYLVAPDQRLQAATRSVASPPLLSSLEALLAAPSTAESRAGLSTALTAQVRVISTTLRGHVAVVNFNSAFSQIANAEQLLAVAQVVYTATAISGVSSVQFQINGKATDVPTDANGAQVQRPVGRAEYAAEAPSTAASGAGAPTPT